MKYLLLTTRLDSDRMRRSMHLIWEITGEEPILIWGPEKPIPKDIKETVVDPSGMGLTEGEIAVALGHARCLRKVIELNEPCIIFEDDFRLWVEGGVTANHVRGAFNSIPEDTDYEFFSKCHVWHDRPTIIEDKSSNHKKIAIPTVHANQCYFVSIRFAKYFYKEVFPIACAADVIWRYRGLDQKFIYRYHFPELIWQMDNETCGSIKD